MRIHRRSALCASLATLALHSQTAKVIGLMIAASVLLRADEVIQ